MNTTIVAVDLAKSVFQLAVADAAWRVTEHHRLTRSQFELVYQPQRVAGHRGSLWLGASLGSLA
ncbi:hypothetical protein [Noviherbaspirillum sp.]|uniref:hypothetical protein n=1 Tax=Noviherbaspirillum sp. TaxID=1926288 RepID=UPI002B49FA65|nr:hypothetical protein [Noviherbaspirillum sp.]HJV81077.1 hypothetical protein [Noviherbaspirillum sp.]